MGSNRGMVVEVSMHSEKLFFFSTGDYPLLVFVHNYLLFHCAQDQRTEIVLATTALVAVVALFLRWEICNFFLFFIFLVINLLLFLSFWF